MNFWEFLDRNDYIPFFIVFFGLPGMIGLLFYIVYLVAGGTP